MGIVRAVSGLIVLEEFDAIDSWTYWGIDGSVDASDKHSGTGSFRSQLPGSYTGYFYKMSNIGSTAGRRVHFWLKNRAASLTVPFGIAQTGSSPPFSFSYLLNQIGVGSQVTVWTKYDGDIIDSLIGQHYIVVLGSVVPSAVDSSIDKLVFCTSDNVTISGLFAGQKVELYQASDNGLIGSDTVGAGETSAVISITTADDIPGLIYAKVYGADGVTLAETTSSQTMCGGDEWVWSASGRVIVQSDAFLICRTGARDDLSLKKAATITATLLDPNGAPYPSATVYFSTSKGTVDQASAATGADGKASVKLTSSKHGLAIARVSWLGDATVPAASGACTIHVFYEVEQPDANKPFQFFIEGIEYDFVDGRYSRVSDNILGDFEVELPEWDSTITKLGLVSIYRKGILEFRGIVPAVKHRIGQAQKRLAGPHVEKLLQNRVVVLQSYTGINPTVIIADLLDKYPCGVSVGNFATYDGTLTLFIQNVSLKAAIANICEIINWQYRVNDDMTLDLAKEFGQGLVAAEFIEGENILDGNNDEDYGNVKNVIHGLGATDPINPTLKLTSIDTNEGSIQDIGLQETTLVQTSVTSQTTLNTATMSKKDRGAGTDYKPVPPQDKGGYGGGGGTGTGGSTHEVPV